MPATPTITANRKKREKGKEREKAPDALVMLSGGLDSATCLYWAKKKFGHVRAITLNYFGRLENEKMAAEKLVMHAGLTDPIVVELPFLKEASDYYGRDPENPKAGNAAVLSSYVPARNLIFYSIAAHYAEFLGAKWIVGGHNSHDVMFFNDASKDYIQKINSLLKEGCLFCDGRPYQIVLPLAEMNRKQVIKLAMELHVPIELTWSCHDKQPMHCGKCYACAQRIEAFSSLGLTDPVFAKK